MRNLLWFTVALIAFVARGAAQGREFLTDGEVDEVREAQEPNDRIKLYGQFAGVRMNGIDKEMEQDSAGRAGRVHDLLYELERIMDTLDDIVSSPDAQRTLMRKGLAYCAQNVPDILKRLQAIRDRNPADMEQYRFALNDAIETTESALEDVKKVQAKLPKLSEKERKKEEKDAQEEKKKPSQQ